MRRFEWILVEVVYDHAQDRRRRRLLQNEVLHNASVALVSTACRRPWGHRG